MVPRCLRRVEKARNISSCLAIVAALCLIALQTPERALASSQTVLADFESPLGANPAGSLLLASNGKVYGILSHGGASDAGLIEQMNTTGPPTVIHSFNQDPATSDGALPESGLVEGPGLMLYGTTTAGGAYGTGTIYSLNLANNNVTVLYNFPQGIGPGTYFSGLVLGSDGMLYGATDNGGSGTLNKGYIYKISPSGNSAPVIVVNFSGANGGRPAGMVEGTDGNVYCATQIDGANDAGTIIQVTPTSSSVICSFTAKQSHLVNSLVFANGMLYATSQLGTHGNFLSCTTAGVVKVLYTFSSSQYTPLAGTLIAAADGSFVGAADDEGGYIPGFNKGYVYRLTVAAGGTSATFSTIHSIGPTQGELFAGLVELPDGSFMGTATRGGADTFGLLYRLIPSTSAPHGYSFDDIYNYNYPYGANPVGGVIVGTNGNLYGVTAKGGASGLGEIYTLPPTNRPPAEPTILYSFSGTDGTVPTSRLLQGSDGTLYGTAQSGGSTFNPTPTPVAKDLGLGDVFKIASDGTGFTVLHNFEGNYDSDPSTGDGVHPVAGVVLGSDGNLYGTTEFSEPVSIDGNVDPNFSGYGTIFEMSMDGTFFKTIHEFNAAANEGLYPAADMVLAPDGYLYGSTFGSYLKNDTITSSGTLWRILPGGSGFKILHRFVKLSTTQPNTNTDGAGPLARMIVGADGNLYGTTTKGGAYGGGTAFQLTTGTTPVFKVLLSYETPPAGALAADAAAPAGAQPLGGLTQSGTSESLNFVSPCLTGGAFGKGSICNLTGGAFKKPLTTESAVCFGTSLTDGTNGTFASSPIFQGPNGDLFGTTLGASFGEFGFNETNILDGIGVGTVYEVNIPQLLAINPTTVAAGTAFTLTASGQQFDEGYTVYWNSTALSTTYGNDTTLTATVPASVNTTQSTYPATADIYVYTNDSPPNVLGPISIMVTQP